jgi:hypothetical protein
MRVSISMCFLISIRSYKETELVALEGQKDIFLELTDMMIKHEKVQKDWQQKELESPHLVEQLRHELLLQLLLEGKPEV